MATISLPRYADAGDKAIDMSRDHEGMTMIDKAKSMPPLPRKPAAKRRASVAAKPETPIRLYKKVVRQLIDELHAGKYAVGDRLPAERELAITHGVSRPAIREAILALEVGGLVEVRIGSGAYVVQLPGNGAAEPHFTISAFEALEARLLLEGEVAAVAALQITDSEIAELETLVEAIEAGNKRGTGAENAEAAFSVMIAGATRNGAIEMLNSQLWQLRSLSPECALMLEKARTAKVRPVVEHYRAVIDALRKHDPGAARAAIRARWTTVIEHLLFTIEEEAVAAARLSVETTRKRHARVASL